MPAGSIKDFAWSSDMHELGILKEMIRIVEITVATQKLNKVAGIVLQVGELCGIHPDFLKEVYPIAAYKTSMEGASIEVQIIPANACCHDCKKVFNVVQQNGACPDCNSKSYEIISGKDFLLKEIIAN